MSSEIFDLIGTDYKIVQMRDSLKLECTEKAARVVQRLKLLDGRSWWWNVLRRWW